MKCSFESSNREFSRNISVESRWNSLAHRLYYRQISWMRWIISKRLPLIIASNLVVVSTVLLVCAWALPCAWFDGLWWRDYHRARVSLLTANHFLSVDFDLLLELSIFLSRFFLLPRSSHKLRRKVKHISLLMTASCDVSISRWWLKMIFICWFHSDNRRLLSEWHSIKVHGMFGQFSEIFDDKEALTCDFIRKFVGGCEQKHPIDPSLSFSYGPNPMFHDTKSHYPLSTHKKLINFCCLLFLSSLCRPPQVTAWVLMYRMMLIKSEVGDIQGDCKTIFTMKEVASDCVCDFN